MKGKQKEGLPTLEQNTGVLAAALAVGVPNSAVRRLTRNELKDFAETLLQPKDPKLSQVADATTISRLESFEGRTPTIAGIHARARTSTYQTLPSLGTREAEGRAPGYLWAR